MFLLYALWGVVLACILPALWFVEGEIRESAFMFFLTILLVVMVKVVVVVGGRTVWDWLWKHYRKWIERIARLYLSVKAVKAPIYFWLLPKPARLPILALAIIFLASIWLVKW